MKDQCWPELTPGHPQCLSSGRCRTSHRSHPVGNLGRHQITDSTLICLLRES